MAKEDSGNSGLSPVLWSAIGVMFGVQSMVLAFFVPIMGIMLAILGIIFGYVNLKKNSHGWARKAIVLSFIGLGLNVATWLVAVYLFKQIASNPELLAQLQGGAQ